MSTPDISGRSDSDDLEDLSSAERRHILVDRVIDDWVDQSFPASDPPGRLPPSMTPDDHRSSADPGLE